MVEPMRCGIVRDHQMDLGITRLEPRAGETEVRTRDRVEPQQGVERQCGIEVVDRQSGMLESFDVHDATLATGSVVVR